MALTSCEPAVLTQWFVVFALVAASPFPLPIPSGIALAAIGLVGAALLVIGSRHDERTLLSLHPQAADRIEARP